MKRTTYIISRILLVLYLFLHVSSSYFYHTHYTEFGVLVHSHLSTGACGEHTHSSSQLNLVSLFNHALYAGTAQLQPLGVLLLLLAVITSTLGLASSQLHCSQFKGRSPPVCSVL